MRLLFDLFWCFFKIGLFTFGGGYAMLPLIERQIVQKKWATGKEILDYYAIAQVTPGIIAVNVATFIGYKIKGISGAIFATIGVVTPSVVLMTVMAISLFLVWEWDIVQNAMNGIRIMIPALLVPIIYRMLRKSLVDKFAWVILFFAFIATLTNIISPVFIILSAGFLGLFYKKYQRLIK